MDQQFREASSPCQAWAAQPNQIAVERCRWQTSDSRPGPRPQQAACISGASSRLYYESQQFLGEESRLNGTREANWQPLLLLAVPRPTPLLTSARPPQWKVESLPASRCASVHTGDNKNNIASPTQQHAVRSFFFPAVKSHLALPSWASRRCASSSEPNYGGSPPLCTRDHLCPSARTTRRPTGWKLADHFCFAPLALDTRKKERSRHPALLSLVTVGTA